MAKKKKIRNNFALQATILAAASIISKLIGMIYNIPLANIFSTRGNGYGNGYYGAAQTWYYYILVIATFSIPAAVSKIMAERIEKGEYRNVKRIFNGAMMYVLVVGLVAAIFAYVCAPYMVTENAVLSLRVLAPTIFLSGFLSVYRGYFQAYGNMVPTSISQVVEQIFNAIVSIAAALVLMQWAVAAGRESEVDKFGAAGSTLGTGIAVVAGLIYMIFLFRSEKKELNDRICIDKTEQILSYKEVIRLLLMIATPIILSSAIYNANVMLDMTIFQKMTKAMGYGSDVIDGQYGLYCRMYLVLANVPIAMAAAVASAVIPGVSSAFAVRNKVECNRKITQSMQLTMIMTIPCAVGFAVLGRPIVQLLYYKLSVEETHIVSMLLLLGGISIVLNGISSVLNGVLQGIGKVKVPVISAGVALVLHVLFLILMIGIFKLGIYSMIFATAFYAIIVVIMNYHYVKKELDYKMEWKQTFGVPVLSATVMGVVAVLLYLLVYRICGMAVGEMLSNGIAVLIAVAFAAFTYFAVMIKAGGYTEEMLETFPKGRLLAKVAKKLHLLKNK